MTGAGGDSLRPVDAEALSVVDKSGSGNERGMIDACEKCLRRSWLLAMLSARLGYQARDRGRLLELLALGDEDLVQAIGGSRRLELRERYARFTPRDIRWAAGVEAICCHHHGYPSALAGDWASRSAGTPAGNGAPRMLYVTGATQRLQALAAQPTVAIVGSRKATDYGMEMARNLARGLAASGVTVTGGLSDGIALAAQAGALEVDGKTLTVMDGGMDVACPARRRGLYKRVLKTGCAVAELPCGCATRSWCHTARERIVVGLAQLTIVVEADEDPGDLLGARIAQALGRTVAAVPGRVTSPVSRGTHALLMEGVPLVRGPGDALDLLYGEDPAQKLAGSQKRATGTQTKPTNEASRAPQLEPMLKATLEQVGAGRDTPAKLTAGSEDAGEVLLALSELELMGLLSRGDGGRYVPRGSLAAEAPL
jgi:DNA processing protein